MDKWRILQSMDIETLLTASSKTMSFKDLSRTCAYLQGRLQEALAANEALSQQNEALRMQQREEAAFAGRLAQDATAAENSARVAEAAKERESARLRETDIRLATTRQHAQQLEERLAEASAREDRLVDELSAAREDVANARAEVADLRAESAHRLALLKQSDAERDGAAAELNAAKSTLHTTRSDLASEGKVLDNTRAEVQTLRERTEEQANALQSARGTIGQLEERCKAAEQEVARLSARAQEAAADALNESEARAAAERMAFALREQLQALTEARDALQKRLQAKARQHREAVGETQQVGAEAHALAIRMGLYRAVLKSDVTSVLRARG